MRGRRRASLSVPLRGAYFSSQGRRPPRPRIKGGRREHDASDEGRAGRRRGARRRGPSWFKGAPGSRVPGAARRDGRAALCAGRRRLPPGRRLPRTVRARRRRGAARDARADGPLGRRVGARREGRRGLAPEPRFSIIWHGPRRRGPRAPEGARGRDPGPGHGEGPLEKSRQGGGDARRPRRRAARAAARRRRRGARRRALYLDPARRAAALRRRRAAQAPRQGRRGRRQGRPRARRFGQGRVRRARLGDPPRRRRRRELGFTRCLRGRPRHARAGEEEGAGAGGA